MLLTRFTEHFYEAGTDEAGRGCLAGPVTAAAIILPNDFEHNLLNDSKLLSEKSRDFLKPLLESAALCYSVTHLDPLIIDQINILNASIEAMRNCIEKLDPLPLHIIVDGNRFKAFDEIPHTCIVKGDSKYVSIAAASILAKTYRDAYMCKIDKEFPMYNWKNNKGYPTKEHRAAIKKYGITKYHRLTFRLLPEQLELQLME